MINIKNLIKKYGENTALNGITFEVKKGEVLGFLGRNGAGKSTTMNIITGCISYDSGQVEIGGIDILENPLEAKRLIGYLPEIPPLYPELKVREYLEFVCDLKRVGKKDIASNVEYCMETADIVSVADTLIRNLSKGYKQRTGFASALCGMPPVLILDEPTAGLDPKQIVDIRNVIKKLKGKHTILFSSHIMSDVEDVSDRIVIIHKGSIVASGTQAELSGKIPGMREVVVQIPEQQSEGLKERLSSLSGVVSVIVKNSGESGMVNLHIQSTQDIRSQIANMVVSTGNQLLGMYSPEMALEDIFLKMTQD